jgi:uncharacterized protein YvpB
MRSTNKLLLALFLFAGIVALGVAAGPQVALAAAGDHAYIRGVPAVKQKYNLSCEYAAAYAVTKFWGNPITENEFLRAVPRNPNPHVGFRGNIMGPIGGLTDYGIYAEPLVPLIEANGYEATVFYGGVDRLKANLRAGNPVVVWLTTGRNIYRKVYTYTYAGESFTLVPGEHALVAYGYDRGGLQVMDVGNGKYYYTDWTSFLRRWSYFDQMSLVIVPK